MQLLPAIGAIAPPPSEESGSPTIACQTSTTATFTITRKTTATALLNRLRRCESLWRTGPRLLFPLISRLSLENLESARKATTDFRKPNGSARFSTAMFELVQPERCSGYLRPIPVVGMELHI